MEVLDGVKTRVYKFGDKTAGTKFNPIGKSNGKGRTFQKKTTTTTTKTSTNPFLKTISVTDKKKPYKRGPDGKFQICMVEAEEENADWIDVGDTEGVQRLAELAKATGQLKTSSLSGATESGLSEGSGMFSGASIPSPGLKMQIPMEKKDRLLFGKNVKLKVS